MKIQAILFMCVILVQIFADPIPQPGPGGGQGGPGQGGPGQGGPGQGGPGQGGPGQGGPGQGGPGQGGPGQGGPGQGGPGQNPAAPGTCPSAPPTVVKCWPSSNEKKVCKDTSSEGDGCRHGGKCCAVSNCPELHCFRKLCPIVDNPACASPTGSCSTCQEGEMCCVNNDTCNYECISIGRGDGSGDGSGDVSGDGSGESSGDGSGDVSGDGSGDVSGDDSGTGTGVGGGGSGNETP